MVLLFAGLRNRTVGIDTAGGYYEIFTYAQNGYGLKWIEPGWVALNKICVSLGVEYEGLLFLAAIISLAPIYYVISKDSSNKVFSIAVLYGMYFVLYSFNLMRQFVAIGYSLLFFYFYNKRKYIKACSSLLVAYMFHSSCLLSLAIIPFARIKMRKLGMCLMLMGSLVFGLLMNNRTISLLAGKYASYLSNTGGYNGFRNDIVVPVILAVGVNLVYCCIIWVNYDEAIKSEWFNYVILGLMAMNATVRLGQGTRIVLFYSQSQCLFIPDYINSLHREENKKIVCICFVIYLMLNFCRILYAQRYSLVPYSNNLWLLFK